MRLSLADTTKTIVKIVDVSLNQKTSENEPSIEEQKEKFLRHGKIPESSPGKGRGERKHVRVSFEFLPEAKRILDFVNEKYQSGDNYLEKVFGERISYSEASKYMVEYLKMQGLDGALRLLWSKDINCCGRIIWIGPSAHLNKPEKRRYSLWLNSTSENVFLRQQGIKGLADHEIGTHFLRMVNDGLQPWFSNRKVFGLRSLNSRHLKVTEEGFAAVNTLLQLNCRLLWWPAFLYYTACMAIKMTFRELFDHLKTYIWDPDQRWKHVTRVKRNLDDYSGYGGTGKDQAYFAGAVQILRNADDIDFKLLYSGKLCFDELKRIKRVSRAFIKLPHFLEDVNLYRHALTEMLYVNHLQPQVIMHFFSREPKRKKGLTNAAPRKTTRRSTSTVKSHDGKFMSYRKKERKRRELNAGWEVFSIKQLPAKVY